jgi:hypothetical protein
LNANNGGYLFTEKLVEEADQFMLINLKQSKSQFVLAINSKALNVPKVAGVKINAYPSSELPSNLDLDSESIFFTSLDK